MVWSFLIFTLLKQPTASTRVQHPHLPFAL